MKVSGQKSFAASCTCDLCDKTSAEPLILSLKFIYDHEQRYLELSYKKVSRTCKKHKTFLPQNYHGIPYIKYILYIKFPK